MGTERITIEEAITLLEERDTKEKIKDLMEENKNIYVEIYYIDGLKFKLYKIKGTNKQSILNCIDEPFRFIFKADVYSVKKDGDTCMCEEIFSNYINRKKSFSTKRLPCFSKEKIVDKVVVEETMDLFKDSDSIYTDKLFKYLKTKIKGEQRGYSLYEDERCQQSLKLEDMLKEIIKNISENGATIDKRAKLITLIYNYGELKERRGRIKAITELYKNLKGIFNLFRVD